VGQNTLIHGIVQDEITRNPIPNVNIRVNGTTEGCFSGVDGKFTLNLDKTPCSLTITCVGYEAVYYDLRKVPARPLDLVMRKTTQLLKEVDISSKALKVVFSDRNYSVLDYEIMDDRLLLIIFRYQLKRSEVVLLTLSGDTLSIVPVPEQKPKCLFRDFLGNVHFVSTKGNAFQCYYNEMNRQLGFMAETTYDSLKLMVRPFLFVSGDRLYFRELSPDGFGARIGYIDQDHNKRYIRLFSGESARQNFYGEIRYNTKWNYQLTQSVNQLKSSIFEPHNAGRGVLDHSGMKKLPFSDGFDINGLKRFYYGRINLPVVKLEANNIAVINFPEDVIEWIGRDDKIFRRVPISFHKDRASTILADLAKTLISSDEWKWGEQVYADDYYRAVYTSFKKNGIVQVRKINMNTGRLTNVFDLPYPFPEKIRIYKGDAYFLNKDNGEPEKKMLLKVKGFQQEEPAESL